jgi:hypothetical protein
VVTEIGEIVFLNTTRSGSTNSAGGVEIERLSLAAKREALDFKPPPLFPNSHCHLVLRSSLAGALDFQGFLAADVHLNLLGFGLRLLR